MKPDEVTDWASKQWKDVKFTDTLQITGYERGRSAANIRAVSKVYGELTIFLTDFFDIIGAQGLSEKLEISGEFVIKKRGANFGVALASVEKFPCGSKYVDGKNVAVLKNETCVIKSRVIPEYI